MKNARSTVSIAAAIVVTSLVSSAMAQTSGSIATQTSANWTVAPWTITSGSGTYPDLGGTATWNTVTAATPGTVGAGATLTLDTNISLSAINYNSPYSLTLARSGTNVLALDATGGTLNANLTIANTPSLFQLANSITTPISGGGMAGLTKTGGGTVTLAAAAASTYTGGTRVNGGILVLSGASGDGVLGATGTGNGITLNGGGIFNNLTTAWTTTRDIFVDAGGGTFYSNTAINLNGNVSGSGTLRPQGFAAVVTTFGANNTFTGRIDSTGSSVSNIALSGNGALANATGYDLAGTLALSNATTNVNDRLSDTAGITSRGLTLTLAGNATAATNEAAGPLTLSNGNTLIAVTPNAAQATSLTLASVTRSNNSTMFIRGTNLGNTPGAGVANVYASSAPTLVGGSGTAGMTNISIVPYAAGNIGAGSTINGSLLTYGATGFRPLVTTEYASSLGLNASDNVRLIGATVVAPASTANALLFAPAATATLSGGPITLTSGAFLYSPTVGATTGTVSAGLDFGAAEGVVTVASSAGFLVLSGPITGSGGVTYNHVSGSTTVSGLSTYTGPTRVNTGTVTYNGNITNDGSASAFGAGTSAASPIILNPGTGTVQIYSGTAGAIFDRDLSVVAGGPGVAVFGTAGDTLLTMNGNIAAARQINFGGGATLATSTIVNGNITGVGSVSDSFSAFTTLNGNNGYTGGTNIQTGSYLAGSNTAFGTGTIFFSGAGALQSKDASAHTFNNSIFLGANPSFGGLSSSATTGALTFNGTVNLNGSRSIAVFNSTTTLAGAVSNGGLTKTATGTLALTNAAGNFYTGGTVLGASAGTLLVNNTTGSGTGSGAVSIGTGSTLAGSFIIAGNTAVNGTLVAGAANNVGTSSFLANVTDGTAASTLIELAGTGSFDKVAVGGTLTLDGTVTVASIGGYVAAIGTTYDVLDWGTLNAAGFTVADLTITAPTEAGGAWDVSNFLTNGTITVVPEPTSLGLIGVAGAALLRRRRR